MVGILVSSILLFVSAMVFLPIMLYNIRDKDGDRGIENESVAGLTMISGIVMLILIVTMTVSANNYGYKKGQVNVLSGNKIEYRLTRTATDSTEWRGLIDPETREDYCSYYKH